jgi:hypothetical protein
MVFSPTATRPVPPAKNIEMKKRAKVIFYPAEPTIK